MSDTAVLEEQILAALDSDPHFPEGVGVYALMTEHFPKAVIAAVGDKLDQLVTFEQLCLARAKYIGLILDNPIVMGRMIPIEADLMAIEYNEMIAALNTIGNNVHVLRSQGLTESELMHDPGLRLNSDMLQAYDAGVLTFRVLITKQPSVFIPM